MIRTFLGMALLLVLPEIILYLEKEPEKPPVILYEWFQYGRIQTSVYNTETLTFSRPIPNCYEKYY